MKTFILFLILGLCKELIAPNQCRSKIRLGDGYCGIASDCYQYAVSFEVLKYYMCRRNEVGRSAITSYIPGFCPHNKPQCPIDYRV